ncbi:MAG: hypothetical protein ABI946_01865 [Chthoniobacterales bacterium]
MTARVAMILERTFLSAIALVFLLPLPLKIVTNNHKRFHGVPLFSHPWLANQTLQGTTVAARDVSFSWSALAHGTFQKSKADRFGEGFPGREALIRWTSEVWFRIFREPASLTSSIAIGAQGALFEKRYLHEYFIQRTPKSALLPWVKNLRRLQDFCRESGMGFLVLIAPSKASFYPDETPLAWRRWFDPRPRGNTQIVELFQENGILFVDAPALLAAEQAAHPPAAPFFPQGGIHWNSRAVWLVANSLQARWQEQGRPLEALRLAGSRLTSDPPEDDDDLLQLLNLVSPLTYSYEEVSLQPAVKPPSAQLRMTIVGDSFTWQLARLLSKSGQFSQIDVQYYYRLYQARVLHGVTYRGPEGPPQNFARETFGADCLLLEFNDASVPLPGHYLDDFLQDAIAHLPAAASHSPATAPSD